MSLGPWASTLVFLGGCGGTPERSRPAVLRIECGDASEPQEACTISGRVFVLDEDGEEILGKFSLVRLDPETAESRSWFERCVYPGQDRDSVEKIDLDMLRRRKQVEAGKDGTFRVDDVAPGSYFMTAKVRWNVPAPLFNVMWDLDYRPRSAMAYAKVKVKGRGSCHVPLTRPGEVFEPDPWAMNSRVPCPRSLAAVAVITDDPKQ